MSNNFFDFDQMTQEQEKEPKVIKIYGKEEELPPSLPANIILKVVRLNREGTENVDEGTLFEMANMIFGQDRFEGWLEKGLSLDQLEMLIDNTVKMYMGPEKDAEEKGGNSTKTP